MAVKEKQFGKLLMAKCEILKRQNKRYTGTQSEIMKNMSMGYTKRKYVSMDACLVIGLARATVPPHTNDTSWVGTANGSQCSIFRKLGEY
jgi:hypothetical protein